jgi:predicted Rossmann fold flavoprotein
MTSPLTLAVVGGGAAGFFAAIACAQHHPEHHVILIEKARQVLSKVRISGGGRCNVTHACFDPTLLVKNYPRGHKELLGPFSRFQPRDTIQWFESRGVELKTEEDGRVFPATDKSESIINCLMNECKRLGVELLLEQGVQAIRQRDYGGFFLELTDGLKMECDRLLVATGSSAKIYPLIQQLGHTIVPLVPSLFTFNIPDSPFLDLAGVSVPSVLAKLPQWNLVQEGALLFTHWGLSGPVILKLSAWGARQLHSSNYQASVVINWIPAKSEEEVRKYLHEKKEELASRHVITEPLFSLPKQLWKKLTSLAGIYVDQRWAGLSHKNMEALLLGLRSTVLNIQGKTTYKQEFVTCGGVALNEVNFKTMESRQCPDLYFAGEILDIDGITGGFNFQNAWATGWIAGRSMGSVDKMETIH